MDTYMVSNYVDLYLYFDGNSISDNSISAVWNPIM